MASLIWKVGGVNRDQLANEIATLRANSPTFRNLEQMALNNGYRSVDVMGPVMPEDRIADSARRWLPWIGNPRHQYRNTQRRCSEQSRNVSGIRRVPDFKEQQCDR